MYILVLILWLSAAISIAPNVTPHIGNLKLWEKFIICLLIMIGAPFMLITQAIEIILDTFLGEGWNNDEDDKFRH